MAIGRLLRDRKGEILEGAEQGLRAAALGLSGAHDEGGAKGLLELLYSVTRDCVEGNDLGPMIRHAEELALECFNCGHAIHEIQTVFNAFEEALWLQILKDLRVDEYHEALNRVTAILGMGKDALARAYVHLAGGEKVPSPHPRGPFGRAFGKPPLG